MAKTGDNYTVKLKEAHLAWGTHRYTGTRDVCIGEGYIPIPRSVAEEFKIYNSNATGGIDTLGQNIFHCVSEDGSFNTILKAQGCKCAGDIYAKQFSVRDDLKALGFWFNKINAVVGTEIRIKWISDTDIVLSVV